MPERNGLMNAQSGLDALDDLLRRQDKMLEDIHWDDIPVKSYSAAAPEPTPDAMDAIVAELDALIGTPSFDFHEHFTPKSLDELTADLSMEALSQPDEQLTTDEPPIELTTPTVGQALDQLWEIKKPEQPYTEQLKKFLDTEETKTKATTPLTDKRVRKKRRLTGVIFYLVLVTIIVAAVNFTGNNGNAPRNLFGYSPVTVLTGSMQSEIPQGSFVLVKHVDPSTLQVGDDITYMYNATTSVTHKIIVIYEDYNKSGQRGFQTKGVENSDPDKDIVPANNVVGKVVWHVPVIGTVTHFISGNVVLLAVSFGGIGVLLYLFVLILHRMFRPGKFEKPKKEQIKQPSRRKPASIFIRS